MKYQLYFVAIGYALYWSTSITEISAFANTFGLTGQVEMGKEVSFEIPDVICIHQW